MPYSKTNIGEFISIYMPQASSYPLTFSLVFMTTQHGDYYHEHEL